MKRNHGQGGMQSFEISHLQPFYEKCGYVPGRAGFTIQWALEDWALSQMAKSLGQKEMQNTLLSVPWGGGNSFILR